jgi:hypothetical protein
VKSYWNKDQRKKLTGKSYSLRFFSLSSLPGPLPTDCARECCEFVIIESQDCFPVFLIDFRVLQVRALWLWWDGRWRRGVGQDHKEDSTSFLKDEIVLWKRGGARGGGTWMKQIILKLLPKCCWP